MNIREIMHNLESAMAEYHAADAKIHRWALLAIATDVRLYDGRATHLEVDFSDQGSFMAPLTIRLPDGEVGVLELEEEGWGQMGEDLEHYASCLRDESYAWQPFADEVNEHRHISRQRGPFALDLDRILTAEGDWQKIPKADE